MPIHPRLRTILALAFMTAFANTSASYAGVPIHLTERGDVTTASIQLALIQKPIHLTERVMV